MRPAPAVLTALLALAAAALATPAHAQGAAPSVGLPSHMGVAVNPDYAAGRLAIPEKRVPTLQEMINAVPAAKGEEEGDDKLRRPAMKEAALAYGARGGLAWTSREIDRDLQGRARDLTQIYDFGRLMVRGPDDSLVMPPVISEARDAWKSEDGGKTLRVADQVYEIIADARFVPTPPIWHTYLVRAYEAPEPPAEALLPRNDVERKAFASWVTEGWMQGIRQAHLIFKADLAKLERDFTGMVRYRHLLAEGKVTAPVLAAGRLGVTGTGKDMRVNDRALRITGDSKLTTDPSRWSPTVVPQGR